MSNDPSVKTVQMEPKPLKAHKKHGWGGWASGFPYRWVVRTCGKAGCECMRPCCYEQKGPRALAAGR